MSWPEHKWRLAPLLPLAWLYRSIVAWRNFFYDKKFFSIERVAAKVVSVGNLSAGGAGKTPTVAFLANALTERGCKVAIVARGYGRSGTGACLVSDGHTVLAEIHEAGDEPLLLAQQCPRVAVVVAESKTHAAQIAAEHFQPDVILVDDGFQHRRLQRELDWVLISARMLMQKPWLLPAGPLREPLRNLRRAHIILLTETNGLGVKERQKVLNILARVTTASIMPINFVGDHVRPLFEGKMLATFSAQQTSAFLVSGIARPERFRQSVEAFGIKVREHAIYRDHHRYSARDVEALARKFQNSGADCLLTTAKDAVKLQSFARLQALPSYVLELRLSVEADDTASLVNAVLKLKADYKVVAG